MTLEKTAKAIERLTTAVRELSEAAEDLPDAAKKTCKYKILIGDFGSWTMCGAGSPFEWERGDELRIYRDEYGMWIANIPTSRPPRRCDLVVRISCDADEMMRLMDESYPPGMFFIGEVI